MLMLELKYQTEHPEYRTLIEQFISESNPEFHSNDESRVEAIMKILIASRNLRLGPAPSIESQYKMREVIRHYMAIGEAIPVLIPSGPKKTKEGESIDVIELNVLNVLNCLNRAVKEHWEPGLHIIFRMENMTGEFLEPDYVEEMDLYIHDFEVLIIILEYKFIHIYRESEHINAPQFIDVAGRYTELFKAYVLESNGLPENEWKDLASYHTLTGTGWKGLIPAEQREMYMAKYEKLYPDLSHLDKTNLMCKYFAAALARKVLDMSGFLAEDHLEFAFMPPIPGYVYPTRFYYRAIDLKNSKRSIPFWRAKGFLKIHEDNTIRISSVTWREAAEMDFHKGKLLVTRNHLQIEVTCDYILCD